MTQNVASGREWMTVDKAHWGKGPWQFEPDKLHWIDEATDLDCLIVRNRLGALCGYVGVPPGHPWHGKDYGDDLLGDVNVHGGLTFSAPCHEGADESTGICHVPGPGRPGDVWWLGFDCAHFMDLVPGLVVLLDEVTPGRARVEAFDGGDVYRDVRYVRRECAHLAEQAKAAAA